MKNVKLLISVGLIIGMVSCGKKGCMDPMSLAYDSQATKDDGTCAFTQLQLKDKKEVEEIAVEAWDAIKESLETGDPLPENVQKLMDTEPLNRITKPAFKTLFGPVGPDGNLLIPSSDNSKSYFEY